MGAGASVACRGRFPSSICLRGRGSDSRPPHCSPRQPFPCRRTCRSAQWRRAANSGSSKAGSRSRPAGAPMGSRAVAWVGSNLEELPNSARAMPRCSLDPPESVYLPESFHPDPEQGGTCSFGEYGFDRTAFQIRLFVAVRGPESFLGRNCSYGARPWLGRDSPATCRQRYVCDCSHNLRLACSWRNSRNPRMPRWPGKHHADMGWNEGYAVASYLPGGTLSRVGRADERPRADKPPDATRPCPNALPSTTAHRRRPGRAPRCESGTF